MGRALFERGVALVILLLLFFIWEHRKNGENLRTKLKQRAAQVEAMAAHGHTQEEIAEFFGMSARSFNYKKKENKILIAAYNRGRFKAKNYVASRLWRYIRNDALTAINLSAITFYIRIQAGWTEKELLYKIPIFNYKAEVNI